MITEISTIQEVEPKLQHLDPDLLLKYSAFSQVVKVKSNQLVFISGQVALDKEGCLAGNDFCTQLSASLSNLGNALTAAGTQWSHVIQMRIYIVDLKAEHRFVIGSELEKIFANQACPANTLIGVQRLARKDLRVEIEAIAACG